VLAAAALLAPLSLALNGVRGAEGSEREQEEKHERDKHHAGKYKIADFLFSDRNGSISAYRSHVVAAPAEAGKLRRLAEKKARDHAGFSFVFKARRQAHSRTM
jgi:hypothetical protein